MKNRTQIIVAVCSVAFALTAYAVVTQIKETGIGTQIGTAITQKIGFWGQAPTNQLGTTYNATNIIAESGTATSVSQAIHQVNSLTSNLWLYGLSR